MAQNGSIAPDSNVFNDINNNPNQVINGINSMLAAANPGKVLDINHSNMGNGLFDEFFNNSGGEDQQIIDLTNEDFSKSFTNDDVLGAPENNNLSVKPSASSVPNVSLGTSLFAGTVGSQSSQGGQELRHEQPQQRQQEVRGDLPQPEKHAQAQSQAQSSLQTNLPPQEQQKLFPSNNSIQIPRASSSPSIQPANSSQASEPHLSTNPHNITTTNAPSVQPGPYPPLLTNAGANSFYGPFPLPWQQRKFFRFLNESRASIMVF